MLSQIIYMGLAMYTPATALEATTDFPIWATILTIGVVSTIYTTLVKIFWLIIDNFI